MKGGLEEVKMDGMWWMGELGEGYRWVVVQDRPAARARGVGGAVEALRGVVLAASPRIKLANLPRAASA